MSFLYWIIIGGIAGWLAGKFMSGKGYGLIANIILGIIGAVVGGFVFGLLGLQSTSIIGSLITAFVGAVLVITVARMIK